MNVQQILLTAITSILLTISVYHFALALIVSPIHRQHLFYSISTLGGAMFSGFALLLTYPFSEQALLLFYRFRLLGLLIGTSAWFFYIFGIYEKKNRTPYYYLFVCLISAVFIQTNYFLTPPIQKIQVDLAGIPFLYQFPNRHLGYTLLGILTLVFFSYSFLRILFMQNAVISKIYGLLASLPGVLGSANDIAITHGLFKSIMLSEYLLFIYLLTVFILFIKEEKRDYEHLQSLNLKLEEEVKHRTQELQQTNERLQLQIIERQKAAQETLVSQKIAAVGRLAGGIAHDFNNMLCISLGNISMAKDDIPPESPGLKFLHEAEDALNQATHLTHQFITFASNEPLKKEMINLHTWLQELLHLLLKDTHIRYTLSCPDKKYLFSIDIRQMGYVVQNIVENAKEAMPDGGDLFISGEVLSTNSPSLPQNLPLKNTPYLKLSFTDTGAGIPNEYLEKIFDPYFSTKCRSTQRGMGLGLSIAYSIIIKHEGMIQVESVEGEGTKVSLYLPLTEPKE